MNKWVQKSLMIAVAVLTLGAIPPSHMLWESLLDDKAHNDSQPAQEKDKQYLYDWVDPGEFYFGDPSILQTAHKSAEEQSYLKFGSRIGPIIDEQFRTVILPNMQQAIDLHLSQFGDAELRKLAISEKPSGDHAEKIFHIYNMDTNKDAIRFHVRTEKKPQEGYFFNFHYHLADDNFQQHITLGDIYWSKNTPPKWLS